MSNESDNQNEASNAMLGWLIAPLAILMALLADYGLNFGLVLEMNEMKTFAVIAIAATLGMAPRVMKQNELINISAATLSLVTLIVTLVLSEGAAMYSDSNLVGLIFFIVMFGGYLLDSKGRHEWNTVLIFSAVGLWTAISAAINQASEQSKTYLHEGEEYLRTSAWQETIGFVFFNTLTIFVILGMLGAVLLRGVLSPATDKGWFGYIKPVDSMWNRSTMPLQIALGVWAATHIAVLYYFNGLGQLDIIADARFSDDYHGYIGFWPAALTGVVALCCAWMCAERWFTRALFIGAMWILYIVSSLYESGHWSSTSLEGTWAVWIWFGITFFIGVVIYWFSTHEEYGGWMNREIHQPSQARVFWSNHWAGIMTFTAFLLGLTIRIQWYFVPSMNSAGLDSWDLTGGSDPWYMKRVVEYVVAENAHLIWDADRNYPVGGINPRPPLFTWSMALGAMLLTNLGLGSGDAIWYAMLALPAVFGALTVFPIAGIAKDNFGKGAGVIAAWLIAFMPTHVQKSTWAMADHDSFVLLFLSAAFMFYLRAISAGGDDRLSRKTSPSPSGIIKAMTEVLRLRRKASANAIAAGVCFGIVALGWKGFVYGPAIIFLAYALQVAMNMLRRKDSTILSTINILMLGTIFLMVLPFYGHPQLDLILNSTGLLPVLFIAGFTLAIAWITTGFRDKPWLLVLGSLATGGAIFGGALYVLQLLEISSAWEVLTTGSGYFTKNKIFGTIAEASAPKRGQLFSAFGPIVFILAIVMGILAVWDGVVRKNQPRLVLGMWVLIAAYMAWSAGRFLFNAAPAMAVMGAWGIVILWKASGAGNMARAWRRMGIRTPGERISNARKAVWKSPQFSAIGMVLLMVMSQHASYGLDAGMPSSTHESEMDETIYNIYPDILRWNDFGFSLFDDTPYDGNSKWYLGAFGSGFNDQGWNLAFDWLSEQDTSDKYSERPAFVSWWDYGFQALESGEHPTVADNFQSGIPATGNMLMARSQEDMAAMFIWRLSSADLSYNEANTDSNTHTPSFMNSLRNHLSDDQVSEFVKIQTNLESSDVTDRMFEVTLVNGDIVFAEGRIVENGLVDTDTPMLYKVYNDGTALPCVADKDDSESCVGDAFANKLDAEAIFNNNVRSMTESEENTTHYIVGDYWYTSDLIEEFDSVSTGIHRTNAAIALLTQMLTSSLEPEDLHTLYADLSDNEVYTVQDYEGAPGEMITRDHEIRYLGIDSKLYPRGGLYSQYNGGSPSGIFSAPAHLSGQDLYTFMDEVYMTSRGQFNDEMTSEEFGEESRKDMLNQQSGATFDPLNLVDIRYDHKPAFFDTMLARAYIGYGASSLGFETTEQPGQHLMPEYASGTADSMMVNALPLPGAMMNHFVISNWYDTDDETNSFYEANTFVKILKYYSGSEVSGTVTMSDDGQPLPNVRLLIERDAFSGEDDEDKDSDTYWIPIGFTDSDENGEWSYTVPAGKIRVSAYAGEYNDVEAKDAFSTGQYTTPGNVKPFVTDLTQDTNSDRTTNLLTALLGNVANMTWMGESTENITGQEADGDVDFDGNFDIVVKSSGISGTVTWSGHESFEGQALDDVEFILRNIWDMTDNYSVTTTSGSFTTESGESRIIPGTGEVTFSSNGSFDTQGNTGIVRGFTGNYTRLVLDGRSYTSNATFDGSGSIVASWIDYNAPACDSETTDNVTSVTLPTWNETDDNGTTTNTHIACLTDDADTYLFEGIVNASGRMTADGQVTIVKFLEDETFEGTGVFEGIGTANGTGQFIGEGTFSGPMVAPGSFYKTGLMPGTYNMIAVMQNGREILLPSPVEVSIGPSTGLDMKMPGSIFEDILYADFYTDGSPTPLNNTTIELLDFDLADGTAPIQIVTDENGSFSYGPLSTGDYQWRVDIDDDGWFEVEENFSVGMDSENVTLAVSVPTLRDLVITLDAGATGLDLTNKTLTFTNIESTDLNEFKITADSDENGVVYVEIPMGQWIISDETNDDYVLWHEIEVTTEDVALDLEYVVSVWVNGTIWSYDELLVSEGLYESPSDIPEGDREAASNVGITARSGLIVLETISDKNGSYSLRLPEGVIFHVTADSFLNSDRTLTAGMLINNASLVTETDLFLTSTEIVRGTVWLRDNSTGVAWTNGVSGAMDVEVIATGENGLQWQDELDEEGTFLMHLTSGNWTFTVSNSDMNVEPVVIDTENYSEVVYLIADPANITLNFHVYLDTNLDGVWSNGTAIAPEFTLKAINNFGLDLEVTEDMYDSETGELNVELSIGSYVVSMIDDNPRDENASEYRRQATGLPTINLGFENPDDSIEIMFAPDYLVSGTVLMENGFTLNDSLVWLKTESGDDFYSLETDENGTFAAYVPQGDWIVEVAEYQTDSNVSEIFRDAITIDSAISDIIWKTKTSMPVSMQLQEAQTGVNITSTRVTAVSLDGLGNVSLGPSDNSGMISELLMPGNWTLAIELTGNLEMWTLAEGVYNSADATVNGTWDAGLVLVDKSVKVGGKLFWDLDGNDQPSSGEGIADVNVSITSESGLNETLVTDEDGVWSLFVPIRDNYTVVAMKEGFANVTFTDGNNSFYTVNDTHESRDFEMDAGMVSVSGNITDIRGASTRLDGATITLHPTSGIIRESVTISSTSYENNTLSWSGVVLPGNWVVVVEGTDSNDNGGGIVIGLLEASVQDGASIDLVMETGGRLLVTSSWENIDSISFTAGDVMDGVDVEIDVGDGMSWITQFDDDGELEFLLPACDEVNCVELDSKFETVQHELNLTMNYTSGISATIMQDTAEDRVMTFNKKVNSDLLVEVLMVNNENSNGTENIIAVADDKNGYDVITLKLGLTYNGIEISDDFTAKSSLGVSTDSNDWTIEYLDDSGDDENWTSIMNLELGIGVNNSDLNQVLYRELDVRITLPLQNQSRTIADGHAVNMMFVSDSSINEVSVRVNVPQQYNISIGEIDAQIGVGAGGESLVTLTISNFGNGDDNVTIVPSLDQDCIDDGWQITPPVSIIPVAPDNPKDQSFTIFAGTNTTQSTCKVDFTAESSGDFATQDVSTVALVSVADLAIISSLIEPLPADAIANTDGIFRIPIENRGFLTASEVIVSIEGAQTGTDYPMQSTTIVVPAKVGDVNGVAYAEFGYSNLPPGQSYLVVNVTVVGTPATEDTLSEDFKIKFSNLAEEGENSYLIWVIIGLTILVLYGGFKTARKGSSGKF